MCICVHSIKMLILNSLYMLPFRAKTNDGYYIRFLKACLIQYFNKLVKCKEGANCPKPHFYSPNRKLCGSAWWSGQVSYLCIQHAKCIPHNLKWKSINVLVTSLVLIPRCFSRTHFLLFIILSLLALLAAWVGSTFSFCHSSIALLAVLGCGIPLSDSSMDCACCSLYPLPIWTCVRLPNFALFVYTPVCTPVLYPCLYYQSGKVQIIVISWRVWVKIVSITSEKHFCSAGYNFKEITSGLSIKSKIVSWYEQSQNDRRINSVSHLIGNHFSVSL